MWVECRVLSTEFLHLIESLNHSDGDNLPGVRKRHMSNYQLNLLTGSVETWVAEKGVDSESEPLNI